MFNAMLVMARKSCEVSKRCQRWHDIRRLYHLLYISDTTLRCGVLTQQSCPAKRACYGFFQGVLKTKGASGSRPMLPAP